VPFGIGITEMIILLLVLLVVFGPKRLPEMGRQLGKGMREFKDSVSGKDGPEETDDYDDVPEPPPAALPPADTAEDDTAKDETASRERDTVS
jgi:sec-independent protein translocase protein TatA